MQFEPDDAATPGRPPSRRSVQPSGRQVPVGRHQPLEHRTVPIEELVPQLRHMQVDNIDPFEHSPGEVRMSGSHPQQLAPTIRLDEVVPPLRFHPEAKSRGVVAPVPALAAVPIDAVSPYSVSPPSPMVPPPPPPRRCDVENDDVGPFGDGSQIFPGSDLF